jgi:hypothetical protein
MRLWLVSDLLWGITLSSRIEDFVVWQAAAFELRRHGDDAVEFSARHAKRLSRLGDKEGSLAWTRISSAIEILRREDIAQ